MDDGPSHQVVDGDLSFFRLTLELGVKVHRQTDRRRDALPARLGLPHVPTVGGGRRQVVDGASTLPQAQAGTRPLPGSPPGIRWATAGEQVVLRQEVVGQKLDVLRRVLQLVPPSK